jgi:adenylate cyclase
MKLGKDASFSWSLQAVVALVFTLIVLALSGLLIGVNHNQLTELTVRDAEDDFRRIANNVREQIAGSLTLAGAVLDTVTLTVDPALPSDAMAQRLMPILRDLDKTLPAAMGIFVGRGDGTHVVVQTLQGDAPPEVGNIPPDAVYAFMIGEIAPQGLMVRWVLVDRDGKTVKTVAPQPTEYDTRQRPWYAPALASASTITTPPYRFSNVPEAGITLARRSSQATGVVFGIDMTLATLDEYLGRLRFPPELELVVFEEDGTLISHPHGDAFRQIEEANKQNHLLTVEDLDSPLLSAMYKTTAGSRSSSNQNIRFDVDGESYFGRAERGGTGFDHMFISLAIRDEVMMAPAQAILNKLLIVSATSVVLGVFIVLLAARSMARPLTLATGDIRRVLQFEFGHTARKQSRIAEIRELARALDTLELALSNFMRYVPMDLVRGIIGRKLSAELGGVRQPVSVLFTDVAGFTPIAEALDPEEVMEKTTRYFSGIGQELLRSGATIDKYIGDSVMAFWNAPASQDDHAALSCLGALRAARRVDILNDLFVEEGGQPMRTRFGLHTGEAVVGNVGSVDRMNYTALGHTVNVASRIEKLNKRYGTTVLVSEAVRDAAGDQFVFRFIDSAIPEGAHEVIRLYELLGMREHEERALHVPADKAETLAEWNEVITALTVQDRGRAASLLDVLIARAPGDKLFRVYRDRCTEPA